MLTSKRCGSPAVSAGEALFFGTCVLLAVPTKTDTVVLPWFWAFQRHFEHVNTTCFNEKYTIKVLLYEKDKNLL
jgi:hypothetical protein